MNGFEAPEGEPKQEQEPGFEVREEPRKCEICGRSLEGRRRDSRWCSRACRQRQKRRERRLARLKGSYSAVHGQSLAELHDRARWPAHWRDIEAGRVDDDLAEYSDVYDVGVYQDDNQDDDAGIVTADAYANPYDPDTAWREQRQLAAVVERIEAEAERQLRPYREALRRNPGVKPLAVTRIEQARDAEIRGLTRAHQHAEALARAAREAPHRAVQAAERQVEYAASNAFGRDLPGGSRRHQEPEWSGRATPDIAVW